MRTGSLADLCYNAFDCLVIDEGVKMKGEETLVGRGVRSMTPAYRLVLTATPVKNRLPDIFRLA
jgi:SNF2 family DNA or RNA helicase